MDILIRDAVVVTVVVVVVVRDVDFRTFEALIIEANLQAG